jgi:PTH1 family peptidyl-tRNA hydrolase
LLILLGIGRPPGKMDPAAFVLRSFTKQEREEVCFSFLQF